MRPRHRELAPLSLSLLDVIAGAMAAFLILTVILLPHYTPTSGAQATLIARLRTEVSAAEARAAAAASQAEGLAARLSRTFLVLYVRWDTRDDVDLHVTDPSGAEFFWNRHQTIPGRPGELSEDNVLGPGNEVWELREAPPGDYQVDAVLYTVRDPRQPVVVKGRVFHRDGSEPLPAVPLRGPGQRVRLATLRVDDQGGVRLAP